MTFRSMRADPSAERFADEMLDAERTMREILEETVTPQDGTILESGRTACGDLSDIRGPLGRFPRSVDLKSCPVDMSGTWHSHVSTRQLLTPEHSLPDMANVLFEGIDASLVVGAEETDVFVAAENRQAAKDHFQNTLGINVTGTEDVVYSLENGDIKQPSSARQRARSELSPLFRRVRTPFPDIAEQAQTVSASEAVRMGSPDTITAVEPMYAEYYGLLPGISGLAPEDEEEESSWYAHGGSHPQQFRQRASRVNRKIARNSEGLSARFIDQATGVVLGEVARRAIFGLV